MDDRNYIYERLIAQLTGKGVMKIRNFIRKVKKLGFNIEETGKDSHIRYCYYRYPDIFVEIAYHANRDCDNYHKQDLKKAIKDIKEMDKSKNVKYKLDEIRRYRRMSKIEKMNERYDGNKVFKDRLDFMENIKYVGEYRGFTMFIFNDKGKDYLQAACPELNVHSSDQIGEFNDDEGLIIENLKSGMDLVIDSSRRISDGKIWSLVLDKHFYV